MCWPSGATVSTTTGSSSWTRSPSLTPIQNSRGVASSEPRTMPAVSGMGILLCDHSGNAAAHEARVPKPPSKLRFESSDGKEVLRGSRIASAAGHKPGQQPCGVVGQTASCFESDSIGDLESHDSGEVRFARVRLRQAKKPRVARETLRRLKAEERRAGPGGQGRQNLEKR